MFQESSPGVGTRRWGAQRRCAVVALSGLWAIFLYIEPMFATWNEKWCFARGVDADHEERWPVAQVVDGSRSRRELVRAIGFASGMLRWCF